MIKREFKKINRLDIEFLSILVILVLLTLNSCETNQFPPIVSTPDQIQNSSGLTDNQLKNDFDYLVKSRENRKFAVEMEDLESFEQKAFRKRIYSLINGFIATERNKQTKGSLKVLAFDNVQ